MCNVLHTFVNETHKINEGAFITLAGLYRRQSNYNETSVIVETALNEALKNAADEKEYVRLMGIFTDYFRMTVSGVKVT